MKEEELIQRLCDEDEEFRRVKEEHAWFHRKVDKLDRRPYLTPAEKVTRDEMKKKKLLLKDKMAGMIAAYRRRLEGGQ